MSLKRLNQNAEIWLSTAPLDGIGSGRITSNAEMRSDTTNSKVSPRSNTSRTLPLRNFLTPGSSIEDCVAICMAERSTLNANFQRPISDQFRWALDVGRSALDVGSSLWLESSSNRVRAFCTDTIGSFPVKCSRFLAIQQTATSSHSRTAGTV